MLGYSIAAVGQIWKEIGYLLDNYHCDFLIGDCYSAPCSAWRAERILTGDEAISRFANCLHLFEKSGQGRPGRYLGFVMVRPISNISQEDEPPGTVRAFPYTTVASLVAPRYCLRPRYHLISCVSGAADGILPYRSVPFCSPGETSGLRPIASCLHAATQEVLLLKMNSFGCIPISSMDMITCLWKQLHAENKGVSIAEVSKRHITLDDGLRFLRDDDINADGNLQTFRLIDYSTGLGDYSTEEEAKLAARRIMMDYLANGIPLVMAINSGELLPEEALNAAAVKEESELNHAIMVFGMHILNDPQQSSKTTEETLNNLPARLDEKVSSDSNDIADSIDMRELPDRFIVHDTTMGPFSERTVENLLSEAWDTDNLSFLAITPKGVRLGIQEVRKISYSYVADIVNKDFGSDYRENVGLTGTPIPDASAKFRYIVRFLVPHQVMARYLTDDENKPVTAEDLLEAETGSKHFWCVEVRLPHEHSSTWKAGKSDLFYSGGDTPPGIVLIWKAEALVSPDKQLSPPLTLPEIRMLYLKKKEINGKMVETYLFTRQGEVDETEGQTHDIFRRRA